jgi:phage baseplate assembly protein W
MNGQRYRAWRFLYPEVDVPEIDAGLQVSARGAIEMAEGDAAVRQAVFLLLSTMPGERVMRPDYGCELYRLIFSPNDNTTAGLAIHYVRQALERWEPRVEVLSLDARRHELRPERLDVTLHYRVRATGRTDEVRFALSLMGER